MAIHHNRTLELSLRACYHDTKTFDNIATILTLVLSILSLAILSRGNKGKKNARFPNCLNLFLFTALCIQSIGSTVMLVLTTSSTTASTLCAANNIVTTITQVAVVLIWSCSFVIIHQVLVQQKTLPFIRFYRWRYCITIIVTLACVLGIPSIITGIQSNAVCSKTEVTDPSLNIVPVTLLLLLVTVLITALGPKLLETLFQSSYHTLLSRDRAWKLWEEGIRHSIMSVLMFTTLLIAEIYAIEAKLSNGEDSMYSTCVAANVSQSLAALIIPIVYICSFKSFKAVYHYLHKKGPLSEPCTEGSGGKFSDNVESPEYHEALTPVNIKFPSGIEGAVSGISTNEDTSEWFVESQLIAARNRIEETFGFSNSGSTEQNVENQVSLQCQVTIMK